MSEKDYSKTECINNGFYYKSRICIRKNGSLIGRSTNFEILFAVSSIIVFLNMATSVTAVGAARLTRLGGTLFRASGVSRAILGSMALASGVLTVTSGIRKYQNRNISRKLFDIISGKSSENIEKILEKISKKIKGIDSIYLMALEIKMGIL